MFNPNIAVALALALPQVALATTVSAQVSREEFSISERAPWSRGELSIDTEEVGPFVKAGATLAADHRFGITAKSGQLYGVYEVAKNLALEARLQGSTGAPFLAKRSVELVLYTALPGKVELTASISRKKFELESVTQVRAQLDREFGPWRIGGGRIVDSSVGSKVSFGVLQYSHALGKVDVRIFKGAESERTERGDATVSDVRTASLGGSFKLRNNNQLRLSITRTLTNAPRTGLSFGFVHSL